MAETDKKARLEELLHAINHDLRTPLGNIRSATAILLQDLSTPLSEDQRIFIEIIERSALRLLDQSYRLLIFSQIAFTEAPLQQIPLSDLLALTKQSLKNNYEIEEITFISNGNPLITCHSFTLSALLALLAAGDTKQQAEAQSVPPVIETITTTDQIQFVVQSQMLAHEFSHGFNQLVDEIAKQQGGSVENKEKNGRKLFTFTQPITPLSP